MLATMAPDESDERGTEYRRQVIKGLGAVGSMGLAGCLGSEGTDSGNSGGGSGNATSDESGGSETTSIEFWQTWSSAEYALYDGWQEDWLNQHPNWSMNQVKIPQDSRREKITSAVASGSLPDLFRGNYPRQFFLYGSESSVPLDDYWSEYEYKDEMVDSLVDTCTYDGKLVAWPQDIFTPAIYYRKDIFDEAGISKFPETWDEWTATADKIANNTDAYAYAMSAGVNGQASYQFFPFVWSSGGDMAQRQDDGSWKVNFDSKESIAGIRRYASHAKNGWVPQDVVNYGYAEVHKGWESGNFAMMTSGTWSIANLRESKPDLDYGIATYPKMPETDNFIVNTDATFYTLMNNASNSDAAMNYIKWLTNEEHVEEWAKELDHMPILKSVRDSEYFDKPRFQPFKENQQSEHATQLPKTAKFSSAVQDPAEGAVQEVVLGNKTPDEAAKDAAETMRQELGSS
jgi:ABC-type glycerol-3-phosphate transport system substrate-binding protein